MPGARVVGVATRMPPLAVRCPPTRQQRGVEKKPGVIGDRFRVESTNFKVDLHSG